MAGYLGGWRAFSGERPPARRASPTPTQQRDRHPQAPPPTRHRRVDRPHSPALSFRGARAGPRRRPWRRAHPRARPGQTQQKVRNGFHGEYNWVAAEVADTQIFEEPHLGVNVDLAVEDVDDRLVPIPSDDHRFALVQRQHIEKVWATHT